MVKGASRPSKKNGTQDGNLSKKEPSDDDLWKQLQNAIATHSSHDQLIWSIFGIFWAANALLLVAIFASNGKYALPVVSAVGVFTSIVWYQVLNRTIAHVNLVEELMSKIENRVLEKSPEFRITLAPNVPSKIGGPHARSVMRWSTLGFLIMWIVAFSIGVYSFLHA
jgi:hypothetical protein